MMAGGGLHGILANSSCVWHVLGQHGWQSHLHPASPEVVLLRARLLAGQPLLPLLVCCRTLPLQLQHLQQRAQTHHRLPSTAAG